MPHCFFDLTDTFWVGRLGEEAVAAVSLSFPIIFLVISRDLSEYAQLESGIAVERYVAEEAEISHKPYTPKDSMILNLRYFFIFLLISLES